MSSDPTSSPRPRVAIAGGGVAALETAYALQALGAGRLEVIVIAPGDELVMRPMAVGAPFNAGHVERFPLGEMVAQAGARRIDGALSSVDASTRTVITADGEQIPYDALVVAVGASPHPAYPHAITFDDRQADALLHGLVQDIEGGYVASLAVIVPAPPPWPLPAYELALMASERAWDAQVPLKVTVFTPESAPLAVFGERVSRDVGQLLSERHVDVVTLARCEVVQAHEILVGGEGRRVHVERIIALPALRGPQIPGLPATAGGFVPVDDRGRVRGAEAVWAAGDATDYPIRHGGVAAQLADTVAAGVLAALTGAAEPCAFAPTLEAVLLTGGHARGVEPRRGLERLLTRTPAQAKVSARYLGAELERRRAENPAVSYG
ncbi:MAG TPA: FAD-dependent oxidoreductase [Solirubrobacteraceae bacterium]|nr:FAD-dependent oxidoreductase [Solirubrobacteraceae bacterium]